MYSRKRRGPNTEPCGTYMPWSQRFYAAAAAYPPPPPPPPPPAVPGSKRTSGRTAPGH